jgi:hypothetical protein
MSKRKRAERDTCEEKLATPKPATASAVFICGGQAVFRGGPVPAVLHDPNGSSSWETDAPLIEARTAAGAAAFNGSLMIVGGAGSGPTPANRKTSVEAIPLPVLDLGARGKLLHSKARLAPALETPRMSPGVAVVGSSLWAIGGW